jgi:hypothetical protein
LSGTLYGQIYSNTTRTLGIANGAGTEQLTVLTNGNVGIGTTAPASKLEIAGGDLNVNGAIIKTQYFSVPANTTKTLSVAIPGTWGFNEVKIAGYASNGPGSCLIA